MEKLFKIIRHNISKRTTIVVILLLGGALLYLYIRGGGSGLNSPFIAVERGTIVQEVTVTGTTKPAENVDLAFEKSGKVIRVYAAVGDTVLPRQTLVLLDQGELGAQLLEAEAIVQSEEAKLAELKRGTRKEDLQVKGTELEKGRQDLANDYDSVPNVLSDTYAKSDDAVRKQTDELFSNDEDANPQLTFTTTNSQTETNVEYQRAILSSELRKWRDELLRLGGTSSDQMLDQALINGKTRLALVRTFLETIMDTIVTATTLTQSTASTYKTNINTGLTNVNLAISNVNTQTQTIASQRIAVKKIEDELALKLAGSTPEEILSQEAKVRQAEAKAQNVRAQLEKTILRSPIEGTITKQDAKPGEIITPNTIVVSVISGGKFKIETNVPEADIAKIKVGNNAKMTLDAFGNNVVFEGVVVSIDPGETMLEGVATYKTTLQFIHEDERIKTGMTANIDILTQKKENVLVIPQRVVASRNGRDVVKVVQPDGTIAEKEVQTGLRGSDGNIEIISGLEEGDKLAGL